MNGIFQHPFNCIVAGPTGSAKSTFIANLILNMEKYFNVPFEYVTIFLGGDVADNKPLLRLVNERPNLVNIVELNHKYPSRKELISKFPTDFYSYLHKEKPGCIIFDDLMSDCGLLNTKISGHNNLSLIHATPNISTICHSPQYLVLFFQGGYYKNFTEELNQLKTKPPTYLIKDKNKGIIAGIIHELENEY